MFNDDGLMGVRSIVMLCESRPERHYQSSACWTPTSICYWPANETELGASMVRAAAELYEPANV